MNVHQMIDRFLVYVDDPRGDEWTYDRILILLNDAQSDVQNIVDEADEHYFSKIKQYSVVPAANDSLEFDLPADFKKVIAVERQTGGSPVEGVSVSFQDRNKYYAPVYYDTFGSGAAAPVWYLRGAKLGVVDPRESYTIRLYYTHALPAFTDEDDISPLPVEHHKVIPLHAAKYAYASDDRSFALWEGEYQRSLQALTEFVEQRKRHAPRTVHYKAY